jgi:hypothetical protein
MLTVITSILTAITPIILAYLANNKKEDRTINLLHKLHKLLKDTNHTKYEVSKIFEMLTGLKLKYDDIKTIINHNNAIWIIYSLQKSSGIIEYDNGELKFKSNISKFQKIIDWIESGFIYIFGFLMVSAIFLFIFTSDIPQKTLYGILIFVFSYEWIYSLGSKNHTKKLNDIINEQKQKEGGLTTSPL